MAILVRRSNLMVPIADATKVAEAWRHNADAITLDLEDGVARGNAHARDAVKDAIASSGRGAAEVFVRANPSSLHADLEASVWRGVGGAIVPHGEPAGRGAGAPNLR